MEHDSTVLIVEDNPVEREILESLLAGQGYNLAFANDGAEGLAKATELTPDLILLDVMMPGMDGFQVCQLLRADSLLANVPVIMVTALDDRESRLRGIESGADNFVSKPYDKTELLAYMRTTTQLNRYSQLLDANQRLGNEIKRLSVLYSVSSMLNSITDIDTLLELIVQQTKELLGVERASIIFHDQEQDELYFPVTVVERKEIEVQLCQQRFPAGSGIAGWVFQEGKPALVNDVNSDSRFYKKMDETIGFVTRSILCVPLCGKDGTLGVLEAVNKSQLEFTEDDQSLLTAIADNVTISIERANLYQDLQKAEAHLRRQNAELKMAIKQKYRFENIVGISQKMVDLIKTAEQVALLDSTVLIHGETGTGKELLAQAIHQSSPRSSRSFVPINCGAIPENLLESELFGHEKGAFTGAVAQRIGRFEEANNGTLFLDEIGDMPLVLQVRLLRVLQEGIIQRLGSNKDIPVDVRVIAATHQDMAQLVAEGRFRQDLYYRLKVFELVVPPLRERPRDIPLLMRHFIKYYNEKFGKNIVDVEDDVSDILLRYDYPGNVRELQHIIESAMIVCTGKTIKVHALPEQLRVARISGKELEAKTKILSIPRNKEELATAREEAQREVEHLFLVELLSSTRGNVSEAARKAGMNRSWLTELVNKHGLNSNRYRDSG